MSFQTENVEFVLPPQRYEGVHGRVISIRGNSTEQHKSLETVVFSVCVLCQERTWKATQKYVNASIDHSDPMPTIRCSFRAIQQVLDDPTSIEGACETLAKLTNQTNFTYEELLESDLATNLIKKRLGKI